MVLWPWYSQGEGWLRDGLMLTGHFGHMAKECWFTRFEAGGLLRRASGVRIVPTVWSHKGAPNSLTAPHMYIFLYVPTSFSEIQIISSSSKTGCKAHCQTGYRANDYAYFSRLTNAAALGATFKISAKKWQVDLTPSGHRLPVRSLTTALNGRFHDTDLVWRYCVAQIHQFSCFVWRLRYW